MFEDTYKTIASQAEGLYKEKGSRFIAIAFPVKAEDEIKATLAQLRRTHHDARHHCYAWRLGHEKAAYRMNDDGEPSGTAGRPIFGQIQSFDLTNVLIVVVRYFGGTKLGVTGLINAYKKAAKDAVENTVIVEKTVNEHYEVRFNYSLMNDVMSLIKDLDLEVVQTDFQLECSIEFKVRKSKSIETYERFMKISGINIRFKSQC